MQLNPTIIPAHPLVNKIPYSIFKHVTVQPSAKTVTNDAQNGKITPFRAAQLGIFAKQRKHLAEYIMAELLLKRTITSRLPSSHRELQSPLPL